MAGQPIEVLGLTEQWGFVGVLVDLYEADGTVLRVKGLLPRNRCPRALWAEAVQRNMATVFNVATWVPFIRREAIVMDCLLTADGEVAFRRFTPEEPIARDLFVQTMQRIPLDSIGIKATVYRDREGWGIGLLSDQEFTETVRILELKTKEFLEQLSASTDRPHYVDQGL